MQNIADSVINILASESQEIGITYFTLWKNKAGQLLSKALQYQRTNEKLQNMRLPNLEQFEKNLLQEQHQIQITNQLIKEMYIFLNEVGETLRGQEIKYEVTLTTGKGKDKTISTFTLTLEQFLNISQLSSTRLNLKKTQTALNILRQQNIEEIKWTSEQIKALDNYRKNIKRNRQGQWKRINKGNILEGYRRKQETGMSTTQSMEATMGNIAGFWQGGDINLLQIKGNNASITNFATCVRQIYQLYQTLNVLVESDIQAFQSESQNIEKQLETDKEDLIQQQINELIKQFKV